MGHEALLDALSAALVFTPDGDEEVDRLQEILASSDPDAATAEITGLEPSHPLYTEVRERIASPVYSPSHRLTSTPTRSPQPAGPPDRKASTMAERTVTIASASGLHARPAGIFAQAAAQQPATVTIEKAGGSAVQASSMLMLMTLGAGHGDEVTLKAEGEGAEESVNALADLLEKDLDAEE
jgi:phosphocarrier protein HPr